MNTERVRPFSLRRYVLIMLLCYAGWVTLYYTTAWIGASRGPVFDPSLPIDATFPIVPWTFFIYLLAYVIVLGLFVIRRNAQFLNLAFSSFIVMNLGAFALFALFPAQGPERDFAAEGGGVIALVHLVDSRFNAFPSLHVANPWLVAFLSLKERGFSVPSMLFLLVAPAISLSTMLVRQHYLLDVLGGFALAVLTAAIVFPRKISSNPW
ncbi:MAG: phosphatase PAP2 family protein [Bacteroidia bacterium]|nr:phosphatase PAP2 family protein [Bacteroidia bacterium]